MKIIERKISNGLIGLKFIIFNSTFISFHVHIDKQISAEYGYIFYHYFFQCIIKRMKLHTCSRSSNKNIIKDVPVFHQQRYKSTLEGNEFIASLKVN